MKYRLDPEKCRGKSLREFNWAIAKLLSFIEIDEEFEYFEDVKPFLNIPEPRKTLDDIIEEYNIQHEYLVRRAKQNFKLARERAEQRYQRYGPLSANSYSVLVSDGAGNPVWEISGPAIPDLDNLKMK